MSDIEDDIDEATDDDFINFHQEDSKKLPTTSVGATLEEVPNVYPTQKTISDEILKRIKIALFMQGITDISDRFKTFDFQVSFFVYYNF